MVYFFTNYAELNKKSLNPEHVKYWINKEIRNSTNDNTDMSILLEYPVVYIHAWENDSSGYSLYVGETYNLTQRLGEHIQNNEDNWHEEWQKKLSENKAFSFFFSDNQMNESMSMDIEDTLFKLLNDKHNHGKFDITVRTKTTTEQGNYSNKSERNVILKNIWKELVNKFDLCSFDSISNNLVIQTPSNTTKDLVFNRIHIKSKDTIIYDIEKSCDHDLINKYPMVYVFFWIQNNEIKTYVGETDNFIKRTKEHLYLKESWEKQWVQSISNKTAEILAFGHHSFNKSMTRDIENRLILYTKFLQCSTNARHNERGKYSNQNDMFAIFSLIIKILNEFNNSFISLEDVQKKAIGLASPFYELTEDQEKIKFKILDIIDDSLHNNAQKKRLIVLYGGVGTGKTMLLSSILFSLYSAEECTCDFLVNNKELEATYSNMLKIWQLGKAHGSITEPVIYYAAQYFSEKKDNYRDVLLIDEGHLLNTSNYMGRAKEQLSKIVDKSKCTVFVFDPFQFVSSNKYWKGEADFDNCKNTKSSFESLFKEKDVEVVVLDLDKQLRMKCADNAFNWITSLCTKGATVPDLLSEYRCENGRRNLIEDEKGYIVGVYNDIGMFYNDLKVQRLKNKDSICLATYDWRYDTSLRWYRINGKYVFHWHNTGAGKRTKNNGTLSALSWYKNAAPDEVGSYHDIQGFDLKYAFVIIGPSIQYSPRRGIDKHIENGIQVNANKHYTETSEEFILNELRILLTRGTQGLLIYAEDEKLRKALIQSLSH